MLDSCLFGFYLCILLNVLSTTTIVGGAVLRMKWSKPGQNFDHQKVAMVVFKTGAFKNFSEIQLEVLELTRVEQDPSNVLFLSQCKAKDLSTQIFFVAAVESNNGNGNEIRLTAMGKLLYVNEANSSIIESILTEVKVAAEVHRRTGYAFQPIWKPATELMASTENNQVDKFFYPENGVYEDENQTKYKLDVFWFVTPNEKMVAIYKGVNDDSAMVVTMEINEHEEQYMRKGSLVEAYEAVLSHLDSELAFLSGWTREKQILAKYHDKTLKVSSAVAWIPKGRNIFLYAAKAEVRGIFGTMYALADTFPLQGFVVIWGTTENVGYKYLHAGQITTLAKAVNLFQNFAQFRFRSSFLPSDYGMGWFAPDEEFDASKENFVKSIAKAKNVHKSKIEIEAFQFLPSASGSRFLHMCLIFKVTESRAHYGASSLKLTTVESSMEMMVDDNVAVGGVETGTYGAIGSARKLMAQELLPRVQWNEISEYKFELEVELARQFALLTQDKIDPILYFQVDNRKLLLIVDQTEEIFYIAFNKFVGENSYSVTWIGDQRQKFSNVERAVAQVKQEAEKYFNRIFAFTERWKKYADASDGSSILMRWNISNTKTINIHCIQDEGQALEYYFEALEHRNETEGVRFVGKSMDSISEVLDELKDSLEMTNLFKRNLDTADKLNPKMENLKMKIQELHNLNLKYRQTRYPKIGTEERVILFSIITESNAQQNSEEGCKSLVAKTDTEDTTITNEMFGSKVILVPVVETSDAFKVMGAMKRIEIGNEFKAAVDEFVFDPLIFFGDVHIRNFDNELETGEVDLVLDMAAWGSKKSGTKIFVRKAWDADNFVSGAKPKICCLGASENDSCFFMASNNKVSTKSVQRLKYVGGLGTQQDASREYTHYMNSMAPLQEMIFRRGIGWYANGSDGFAAMRANIYIFLENQRESSAHQYSISRELFENWRIGIMSATTQQVEKHLTTYGLYGPVETDILDGFCCAIVEVFGNDEEIQFKKSSFGPLRKTLLHAEHDIYEAVTFMHE